MNEAKLTRALMDDALWSVINNAYETPPSSGMGIRSEEDLKSFLIGSSDLGFESAGDANHLDPDEFSRKISPNQHKAFDLILVQILKGKSPKWLSLGITWFDYASHWDLDC